MFKLLVERELKSILYSPKFTATFGVCALLIILSVFAGVREYDAAVRQHDAAATLVDQELREATSWLGLSNRVYRAPDPMQIFVSGVHNDIGRFSLVSGFRDVKLRQSPYSIDPIFAVFRYLDFTLIVQVVLSLFAILFAYNAISGEKEEGTLKLALSNAVPRAQYLLAKFVGSWLGLVVPLLIPIALGVLLVLVYNVPMTDLHWQKLGVLIAASVLYFTAFLCLALCVSAFTKQSAASFLVLLVIWIFTVLIVPRAGMMVAAQVVPLPTISEVESQKAAFQTERMQQYMGSFQETLRERTEAMRGMSDSERQSYEDDNMWDWMEESDRERKAMEADITEFNRKLTEQVRNQQAVQERLGFNLSRVSPAAAFQLVAMNIAGTDIGLKNRYEDAIGQYRTTFNDFTRKKQGQGGGRIITFGGSQDSEPLDLAELPRFSEPETTLNASMSSSLSDMTLLALFAIAAFGGAFVGFLRYDVR